MIAFADRFVQKVREQEREKAAVHYGFEPRPFRNPELPDVTYAPLGSLKKCVTHGCPAHIAIGETCTDCRLPTVPLRQWRRAVDAGEIVR